MTKLAPKSSIRLPSVDRLATHALAAPLIDQYGRTALIEALRAELANQRLNALARLAAGLAAGLVAGLVAEPTEARAEGLPPEPIVSEAEILGAVSLRLGALFKSSFKPVLNLTGTVLHTNLGRAPLPQEALDAVMATACGASNLEFDLSKGARGDRDEHVEALLCWATGAQAATVVNNNAAAVFLVLNALALKREVPVSRGELIEIGGSFRIPDIMARAGCRLIEVGTTNRTHLSDFVQALNKKTALVMKVHTSNYIVQGFTATVSEPDLAQACHAHHIPFVVDLGAGSLIDLAPFGLPSEPTPRRALEQGADLVMFSGDKLLGGPQVGIIVGKADLIAKIKRNPLKRALRIDKMSMAALEAVLRLYLHPERLKDRLPALRLLSRSQENIRATARKVQPFLSKRLQGWAEVQLIDCASEIGSGAQPGQLLKSAGLAITPVGLRGRGSALKRLQAHLRALPVPVLGRIEKDALILDFRCIEDERLLLTQLKALTALE